MIRAIILCIGFVIIYNFIKFFFKFIHLTNSKNLFTNPTYKQYRLEKLSLIGKGITTISREREHFLEIFKIQVDQIFR